jgi:hypothetical protein
MLVLTDQAHPNVPIRATDQTVLDRIRHDLIDYESQRNRPIGIELNSFCGIEIELAVRAPTNSVGANLLQVLPKINVLDICAIRQAIVGTPDGGKRGPTPQPSSL